MNHQAKYFETVAHNSYEAFLADNNNFAFNEFIHLTVENGLLGLMFVLCIILFALYSIFENYNRIKIVNFSIFITFLSISFFSYPLNEIPLILILTLILSVFSTYLKCLFKISVRRQVFLPILVFLILVSSIWVFNRYIAYYQWGIAKELSFGGDVKLAINEYEKANKTLNQDGFFLFNYGCTLSEEGYCTQAIPILIKTTSFYNEHFVWEKLGDCYKESNYLDAERCYKRSINMVPHRFIPIYKLYKLYKSHNKMDEANKIASIILNKKVKIPSELIDDIVNDCTRYLK